MFKGSMKLGVTSKCTLLKDVILLRSKIVDGLHTSHSNNYFTVVMCISADGKIIYSIIIFKALKKVPKINIPKSLN